MFQRVALRHPKLETAQLAAESALSGLLQARHNDDLLAWAGRLRREPRLMQRKDFAVTLAGFEREARLRKLGRFVGTDQKVEVNRSSCDAGDARACNDLGVAYSRGDGVRRDLAEAARLFQKACDARDRLDARGKPRSVQGWQGCSNLAAAYLKGEGVPRDLTRALHLAQMACNAADHCVTLGTMYLNGEGVSRDPRRAAKLFARACSRDLADACTNAGAVALSYLQPPDVALALRMFRRGCQLDEAQACRSLSAFYFSGRGVKKDVGYGTMLLGRACRLGLPSKWEKTCKELLERFPNIGK